ncbi:MAG: GGDEF domain-containing protein [Planctomycetota bacterium]|nr:GGDEF domain-containing protein [Planctomycetota bacterium]
MNASVLSLRGWIFGLVAMMACLAMGALVALSFDNLDKKAPSILWALAVCAVPSGLAGVLLARQMGSRYERPADEDPLTGLQGEARMREALAAEHQRARRIGKQVGVVVAEIDQQGRMSVPHYLAWRSLAKTLKSSVRLYDATYVLSPGRFAILLSGTTAQGGEAVIARVRNAVVQQHDLKDVQIRYGQAISDPADEGVDPAAVLERAIEDAQKAEAHAGVR